MEKRYYGLTEKEWNDASVIREKRAFEFTATVALAWFLSAEQTYRAALILATVSAKATKEDALAFVASIKRRDAGGNKTYYLSASEMRRMIDSKQINVAIFLIARSIEMLLKAIIIEKEPERFFKKVKFKMQFEKRGHDLLWLTRQIEVPLTEKQEYLLVLLTFKSTDGLYPQPNSVNDVMDRRLKAESKSIKLNGGLFKEATRIYDNMLNIYRDLRINNGKTQRANLFSKSKILK